MQGQEECGLFDGASGKLVVLTLTAGAFFTYLGVFALRRAAYADRRSWRVFALDLSKMGIGQAAAYAVNVLNSHRNAANSSFDPVSWYFPTFLNDELIAVPLGVATWHSFLFVVRRLSDDMPDALWLHALRHSGKYYADPKAPGTSVEAVPLLSSDAACGPFGRGARSAWGAAGRCFGWAAERPPVRYDWWCVQLFFWVCCVLFSRILGGLVVPTLAHFYGESSPYFRLAGWIYHLPMTCAAKRWTFAGFFRIAIDLLQLAFVDALNKYRRRSSGALHSDYDQYDDDACQFAINRRAEIEPESPTSST